MDLYPYKIYEYQNKIIIVSERKGPNVSDGPKYYREFDGAEDDLEEFRRIVTLLASGIEPCDVINASLDRTKVGGKDNISIDEKYIIASIWAPLRMGYHYPRNHDANRKKHYEYLAILISLNIRSYLASNIMSGQLVPDVLATSAQITPNGDGTYDVYRICKNIDEYGLGYIEHLISDNFWDYLCEWEFKEIHEHLKFDLWVEPEVMSEAGKN